VSCTIIAFDTETTTADPKTTRVVQLAAIKVTEGQEEVIVNCICDPERVISAEAEAIHGISQARVAGQVKDHVAVCRLTEQLAQLALETSVILAGHNSIGFDTKIVYRLAEKSPSRELWNRLPHIDTYIAAIRLLPDSPNHQLSTLAVHYGLVSKEEAETKAHDALFDIGMVVKLIPLLLSEYKKQFLNDEFAVVSLTDFADWLKIPMVLKRIHFGKHRGKLYGRGKYEDRHLYIPSFYINFITEKFTNPLPDLAATIKHHYGKDFTNG
jgi:DNA polymerase III epsilon subunit-like protein